MATNASTTKLSSFIIHSLFFLAFSLLPSSHHRKKNIAEKPGGKWKTTVLHKIPKNPSNWKTCFNLNRNSFFPRLSHDFDSLPGVFSPSEYAKVNELLGNAGWPRLHLSSSSPETPEIGMRLIFFGADSFPIYPVYQTSPGLQTINNPINFNFSFNCFLS